MKRYKILIALVFLFGMGVPAEAQYFDWVKSYTSCANRAVSKIERAVTDSEGNVYFLGDFHKGAMIDGEDLLPVDGSWLNFGTCLVKLSPDGQLLWHKALWNSRENQTTANMRMVGDSMLVFMGFPHFSPVSLFTDMFTYYWDTVMQGMPFKSDSVNNGSVIVYFNLDGSIKEQHFLNVGYNDTAGNPIYSHWPIVAREPLLGGNVFAVDNEGNVIIVARQFDITGAYDPVSHTSRHYTWENGDISAIRIMVDGERSFFIHSRSCPRFWNYLIMKFSPHFDSLIAARFLFEPSNTPIDFDRGSITVPPDDPSFPMDEYRSYMCNENTILESFEIDEENNIYVVGTFIRSEYCCRDTLIPVDSAAGIYLTLKMIPSNNSSANYCTLLTESYLIKFDPQLRPQYLKQLDYPKRGKTISTKFYHVNVTDSGLIVPIHFLAGSVGDPNPDKYFSFDGDTLPLWMNKSAAFLRLDKGDGHLLAYGGVHAKGNSNLRGTGHSKGLYFSSYAANNNRFASGISTCGDLMFADSLYHYTCNYAEEKASAVVIWDYSGHEILYIELSGVDNNFRNIGGALFSDSSLYIYGSVSNMTLHFGDLLLDARHGESCTTAFIARYVDTAFLRPYVYVPPEIPQEPEDIRVLVQDDMGCVTVYPNPFRQRVRVRYKGEERLREAYLTDMAGRRETVTLVPCGEGEWSVDFAHLPPAPYLLTLVTDSGQQITARLSRVK